MPVGRLIVASGLPSADGLYHCRYPQGNAPANNVVGSASAQSSSSGTLSTGVRLSGAASAASAFSGSLTTGSGALGFPRVMLVGNGGDQSYGSNSTTGYPAWTTASAGSAARTAIQKIGAWDIWIGAGVFEGWDTSGARDRENLTQALLKNGSYSVTLSQTRQCLPFYYHIMNAGAASGGGYQQLMNQIVAMNGWLYESAGGTGTIAPAGGSNNYINYSVAYPGAIGSAGVGQSIVGTNYGSTSSGSPTGAQGVARTNGNYAALKLLIRNASTVGDTRFSFNQQMASPSAGGVFLDDCFIAMDGAGSAPTTYLDGINAAPGTQQGGGYPGLDTPQPVLARGNFNFFEQMQTMLASYGASGNTYYNFANFGQYANNYQFGTQPLSSGLANTLHGGLLEDVIGAGASSWEWFQTAGTNPSGWNALRTNYYQGMDFCQSPKLVGLGVRLPATDGSQTSSFGVSGSLTTVATGTALEYQLMRYALCTALLDDGYLACGVDGYDWSLVRWYDEFGDDSLTQVNVKRGYLGVGLTTRPTSPTWSQGTLGVWSRSFTNGIAIVNPRGNGSQTISLGDSYTKLSGAQQPSINSGATVTSVTVGDGDGIILLGPN